LIYPEAIPLVTHEAADVAKALISVFSHFDFPSEILSDCGTEFVSKLMKIILSEFGTDYIRTSPYYPATNGPCERFNGTLKSMMSAVADEFPDSWDQTIPWILLAKYPFRPWGSLHLNYFLLDRSRVLCHWSKKLG